VERLILSMNPDISDFNRKRVKFTFAAAGKLLQPSELCAFDLGFNQSQYIRLFMDIVFGYTESDSGKLGYRLLNFWLRNYGDNVTISSTVLFL